MFHIKFYNRTTCAVLLLLVPAFSFAQGILNTAGSHLVANSTVKIVLNNSGFTNNGTFNAGSGDVVFAGSSATAGSFVAGSANTSFYNLILNKSANGMLLNRNIGVVNSIVLTSGDSLFLNNYNIDLGSSGSLVGETGTKRITGRTGGYIQLTQTLNAPAALDPGNLGFKITSAVNLGSTVIRRGHQQQAGKSVYRYYNIIPTNNSGLAASVSFYFFDQELAGLAKANLAVFTRTESETAWTNLGEDAIDQTLNFVTVNNIGQLNRFTLAHISYPLAIKLLSFNGRLVNEHTLLSWTTAYEVNNSYFDIQRSADGIHYLNIGRVEAKGNSSIQQDYQFTDITPVAGKNYYRLRHTDMDGHAEYTHVVMVQKGNRTDGMMAAYPNPAKDVLRISIVTAQPGVYMLDVYDVLGKLVMSKPITCIAGRNEADINVSRLPKGLYSVKSNTGGNKVLRFAVQ